MNCSGRTTHRGGCETVSVYSVAATIVRVRARWKAYFLQSGLACGTTLLLLLLLSVENAVVIAAMGASAFIVFCRPLDVTARPKNVIGGHLVGFATGSLCALLPQTAPFVALSWCALAVGLSILLMLMLYLHHPPAAATALGVAMRGYSDELLVSVLTMVFVLAIVHYAIKPHLNNLY